jgi:DNA-binding CsgD family transcriptional regulator
LGAFLRKSGVDSERLLRVGARLGDAAIDPTIWPEILDQISAAAGAAGAVLLQSDLRTTDVPVSPGASELVESYFAHGWHSRDVRAERGVPLLVRGEKVITDQDIVTPNEMQRLGYYTENLATFGFQWSAIVGFWSGSALWGLSIQRKTKEGSFDSDDKYALGQLSQRLTEVATLSKAVGRSVLSGVANALHMVRQPVIAVDRLGLAIDINSGAEHLFDDDFCIKNRRLCVRDEHAKTLLKAFVDKLQRTPDTADLIIEPITVRRRGRLPLVIRVIPIDGAARSPFLGARALLIFSDLEFKRLCQPELLSRAFGLSPAEARLASLMSSGTSTERAADELGLARETVRNQLKSIFAKTDTHRQSELVALLSRL